MIQIGNDAGWHLLFQVVELGKTIEVLSIGAGDYYAEISATLPSGLEGGAYRFSIEGISNPDYRRLHEVWTRATRPALLVDLYLYWRDTALGIGALANLGGLSATIDALDGLPDEKSRVARLVVTELSRRVGRRRFEAVIEAREQVYDALTRRLQQPSEPASDPIDAALAVAKPLHVTVFPQRPLLTATASAGPPRGFNAGTSALSALAELQESMAARYQMRGRDMFLIRDGALHVGPGRSVPLIGEPVHLDESGGLVHVESRGKSKRVTADDEPGTIARVQYSLTLKGRPDLKPGDRVTFVDPLEVELGVADVAGMLPSLAPGALSGIAPAGMVDLYVSSVNHELSRTLGFVTTLTGVEILPGKEWDAGKPQPWEADAEADPVATTEAEVAGAIRSMVRDGALRALGVAEVRAQTTQGTEEPPRQTVDVWYGSAASDGLPFRARRLDIDRESKSRINGVPYLTPFAWGKAGLVLPRYPGTRVVLGHCDGRSDDPVDLGALWPSGHGPDAQPGDWWLILPAAVGAPKRASIVDAEVPQDPGDRASNDLIDADGARVIEVGRLTVRVQPTKLSEPGKRPTPPAANQHVTIEHENGSRIVISENGDITIESKANLTLRAADTVSIDAKQVNVTVQQTMDVR